MLGRNNLSVAIPTAVISLLVLPFIGSLAQAAAIEEVLVTARKVEESQQDVPIAVTTISGEDLEAFNVREVRGLFDYIPGAWSGASIGEEHTISIRGIYSGDRNAADNPAVTLLQDGEVISRHFMASAPRFDLQRVEVLRGPQGTTYGRNATAGTVNFITNRPTDEFSSSIRAEAGNYGLLVFEGFVNGSMGDRANGRLSGYYTSRDGYTEHSITGESLDDAEVFALRGQVELELSENASVLLRANYSNSETDYFAIRRPDSDAPWGYSNFWGWPFLRFQEPSTDPWHATPSATLLDGTPMGYELETWGVSAEIEHSRDGINLYSLTALSHGEDHSVTDLMTAPIDFANENNRNDADTFSQEIRLDNAGGDSRLGWVIGAYYSNEKHDRDARTEAFYGHCEDAPAQCLNPPPIFGGGIPLPSLDASGTTQVVIQENRTDSYAFFGELSYDITASTRIIGGLRYTKDERNYDGTHSASGGLPFIFLVLPVVDLENADSWDDFSGRVAISHRFNDQVMLYGSYATGFKGGGFNPEPADPAEVTTYDEENVRTIEVGAKMDLLDDRLRLNLVLFDSDYDDIQSTFANEQIGGSEIANVGKAYIRGGELEGIAQIGDSLRAQLGFTYYDSEYEEFSVSSAVPRAENIIGEALRGTYKWSLHAAATYTVRLAGGAALDFRADYRGRGRAQAVWVNDLDGASTPGVDFLNASVQYTSPDQSWAATLWGRNLTEEAEIKYKLAAVGIFTDRVRSYAAPRTYGFTLQYNFN